MHYYRVTIAYKGTQYFGWQAQSANTTREDKATVEGTLLNCLKTICHYQPCTISAASRTDAGVHAQGQLARITLPDHVDPAKLATGLNSLLPPDIRILSCDATTAAYQPGQNSISKEYHYYFSTSAIENVAFADISLHVPLPGCPASNKPFDLALLKSGCQLFVGKHDFYNFSSRDAGIKSSIRQITYCDIHSANFAPLAEDMYYLKVIGDGFLKYMIRYLAAALFELARGNITLEDIAERLMQHQEQKLCPKAKAKGLHLINIVAKH